MRGEKPGSRRGLPGVPGPVSRGAFGSGTEGTWEPRLTSGESEARGWEREFLPERGCGCGSAGPKVSVVRAPNAGPTAAIRLSPAGHPGGR